MEPTLLAATVEVPDAKSSQGSGAIAALFNDNTTESHDAELTNC